MLTTLSIKNFAVINETALRPHPNFTAITGETGAGKSLLIETLNLLSGARADTGHVQTGKKTATIEGTFCLKNNLSASNWLKLKGLEANKACTVKRVIDASGKSKAYINNQSCTLQTLKQLGPLLVSIHAQHQYHNLLDKEKQLYCLDQFGGLLIQRDKTLQAYQLWRNKRENLASAKKNYDLAKQRFDLLQYQTKELTEVELTTENIKQAYQRHQQLNNTETTLLLCQEIEEILSADNQRSLSALSQTALRKLAGDLSKLPQLEEATKLLQEQAILLDECLTQIHDAQQLLEHDPETLNELNQFLDQVGSLSRKHQIAPEALPNLAEELEAELKQLSENDLNLGAYEIEMQEAWEAYLRTAKKLSKARQKSAKELSLALTHYLHELGMPEATINFELTPQDVLGTSNSNESASPNGIDQGELMFSPHQNITQTPLRKTASGGELSRISLALFMLCQQGTNPLQHQPGPLLVFDEVDTGMGGQTGDLLAQHLKELSNTHQIMCITHLPQIAARSDKHVYVAKNSNKKSVASQALELSDRERQQELERMLGLTTLPKNLKVAAKSHWQSVAQI